MLAELAVCLWLGVLGAPPGSGGGDDSRKEARAELDALAAKLRGGKPEERRTALHALVRLATPAAWLLVMEALADVESNVGDDAQLALAALADAKLIDELFGKRGLEAKDERVALRTAELLGRLKVTVDGEQLSKRLSTRDVESTRMLLWSLERLARAERLGGRKERIADAVARIEASRADVELSCAALAALAPLDPVRATAAALEACRERASERRCAALYVLGTLRSPQALAAAVVAGRDDDGRVRMAAVECLDALGTRMALLTLVARLGDESRVRIRWRIVDVLQQASGLKHRLDPRPWKLWAEALPEGGPPRLGAPPSKGARDPGGGQVTRAGGFAGLQLLSDRVCFLFDFSGSMWMALDDGRLPKDIVADKLAEALEALPETTEFNLIPFTNEPIPWEKGLRPAKKPEVRRALEFFLACREHGRGNFYDAALLALADPKVDTLVVLTDGAPTGGFHSDMDLITPLLVERTRFRKLVVDAILVDSPSGLVRRWQDLARLTGGRTIEVDLGATK